MTEKKGISGSTLKIIAIVTMLVDHTAAVLLGSALVRMGIVSVGNYTPAYIAGMYEEKGTLIAGTYLAYQIMRRIIGRLAFPIFCFLLVEGFQRTKNRYKYAGRLFAFAILSEIPFDLAFHKMAWYPEGQNVFFTLLLGVILMSAFRYMEEKTDAAWMIIVGRVVAFLAVAVVAELIQCDYGAKGVMVIAVLYLFRKNKVEQLIAGCVAFFWEIMAIFSFIPIACYNGKRGLKLKYIFYAFYPVHLLILYVLDKMLG